MQCKARAGVVTTALDVCVCAQVKPPLKFSHNRLEIAATPLGETASETFTVTNVSKTPQQFGFVVQYPRISISPASAVVQPGQSLRVIASYHATVRSSPKRDLGVVWVTRSLIVCMRAWSCLCVCGG